MSFNPNKIKPHEIDTYNSWEELNRFYGVVNINKDLGDKWKAIIEFQPGKDINDYVVHTLAKKYFYRKATILSCNFTRHCNFPV